ncbi:Glu/Leu/Phe/Val dehydrogenase dimerization domain-containing protein [Pseudohaliea sp.]|uniref:Glu/Leu/Phe/Val family dehydrogenase n=1 Tax=Pseudohaliea sp. TaxID=2740289 RepID=UPI0032EE6490
MNVFSAPAFDDHEQVCFARDPDSGLKAIIAIHDTTLGPAVGGCRMFPYASEDAALEDVLRLSRGMTFKSALAGLPLGGGKSVIIGDPRRDKSRELFLAMGRFVDSLGGRYVAAEDSGIAVADVRTMGESTAHVSGIGETEHGGDPSPSTALGVFLALRAAVRHRLGAEDLAGLRVAVQGLGHVGFHLARRLVDAGARVFGADVNDDNVARAVRELGVTEVPAEEILALEVDVVSPCALGAVLNSESIPNLRAGIVAGAANNQLASHDDGARLMDRGILYCPDFLINAGGIIDVYHQRLGSDAATTRAHVARIEATLGEVLTRADACHRQTQDIAEDLARELLGRGVHARARAA